MSKASGIPNAWDDDDWEAQADRERTERKNAKEPQQVAPQQASMSRQERLQQHAEANRKLWESAYADRKAGAVTSLLGGRICLLTFF